MTDAWWREALLLTVGSLGAPAPYEQREALVAALCGLPGSPEPQLAAVELCATGLLDLTEPEPTLLDAARRRLVELLTAPSLNQITPPKRAAAGDALARLGDPRSGVGLRGDGLPDIVWCEVPAGPFIMGEGDAQRQVDLGAYSVGKYLATNAQYAAFVWDSGYTEKWRRCWTRVGWEWKGDRTGPDTYGGVFDLPNHPVVMVTWCEALAFCRWLTERLQEAGEIRPDQEVMLPTEVQWEKTARGEDGGVFPWGDEFDATRCNMADTGIGSTSAVGIFPAGASPYEVHDMSGNVWEWCRTKWRDSYREPAEESLEGDVRRVSRGSAYVSIHRSVRCGSRSAINPNYRDWYLGFRVVVVAPVIPSGL